MSQVKALTGGLIVIMLGLAGGTGYLIYERVNSEIATSEKATKQEVNDLKKDVKTVTDNVTILEARVATNRKNLVKHAGELQAGRAERKMLKEDMSEIKNELSAEMQTLKQRDAELEESLKSIETDIKAITDDNEKTKQTLRDLVEKHKATNARVDELSESNKTTKTELERLREENDSMKERLEKLEELLGVKKDPPKP